MDESVTSNFIGKYLLIGITYVDSGGNPTRREQKHGEIIRVNMQEGIVVQLDNGEIYKLPPALEALHPAEPGTYTLKPSGEEIEDPDFVSTWTITPRESQGN